MEADTRTRVIEIARDAAGDRDQLAALARLCYPDVGISVEELGPSWRIRLSSVARLAAGFDPDLPAVLASVGCDPGGIMSWRRISRTGGVIWAESMSSAWALAAWSRWIEAGGTGRPQIVHLDPHDDLGVPMLVCDADVHRFLPLMEDGDIDLRVARTVDTALEHGLIGIGAFIVPLLRAVPADVIHVVPSASVDRVGTTEMWVHAQPWATGSAVDRLTLSVGTSPACVGIQSACSYRQVVEPEAIEVSCADGQPVFVDIDLSYFGTVGGRRGRPSVDACSVGSVVDALTPLAPVIACVTIACSPGLSPARRWPRLLAELRARLGSLLGTAGVGRLE